MIFLTSITAMLELIAGSLDKSSDGMKSVPTVTRALSSLDTLAWSVNGSTDCWSINYMCKHVTIK